MILQSLVDLYERLRERIPDDIAEYGFQRREISYLVDLAPSGKVHDVRSLLNKDGRGRSTLVPKEAEGRSGKNPPANLLYEKPEYALGIPDTKHTKKKGAAEAETRATTRLQLFRERVAQFRKLVGDDQALIALERFLSGNPSQAVASAATPELWQEIARSSGLVGFRLAGDPDFLFARPSLRQFIRTAPDEMAREKHEGQCLVTGRTGPVARLHTPKIKGLTRIVGGRTEAQDRVLISFDDDSFKGYGLERGLNAPVSTYAAFAYATALNALLARDSGHRAQAGNVTVVFWAGRASPNEEVICPFLAAVGQDDPSRRSQDLQALYRAPFTGARPCIEDDTPFLILGLSAESKSRLTVRFFHNGTIEEAARNIIAWHEELRIAPEDGPPLSIYRLLCGLAIQGDIKNAPPLLGAELLRSAYTGTAFPQRVLAEALVRCAAEQGPSRERAALIKAFLIRNYTRRVPVELDPDEPDTAYRLGRLFAVLEWVQDRAVNAKAGIAERYWGSASTTPAFVFADLLSLTVHHLAKLDDTQPGFATNRREEIEAIVARPVPLPAKLPARLELVDQGSFAIGYWQQRARRFSSDKPIATEPAEKDAA